MTKYELLYLVPSTYTDAEVAGVQTQVADILKKHEVNVTRNEALGRLKLAYPIKRHAHGTYVLVHFEAESEALPLLDRTLRLTDEVLRHQIILLPAGADNRKYDLQAYVAPLSEEGAPPKREKSERSPSKAPAASSAPSLMPPPPARAEAAQPMSIEDLDKKLEKILEDDISKSV